MSHDRNVPVQPQTDDQEWEHAKFNTQKTEFWSISFVLVTPILSFAPKEFM